MCVYCGVGFDIPENFYNHYCKKRNPILSASNGALKVFKIIGSGGNDLMQFMTDNQLQIDQLVSENANRTGRKMQLYLKVELLKLTKDEDSELFLRQK